MFLMLTPRSMGWKEIHTASRFYSPSICPFLGRNWKAEGDGAPGHVEKGGVWTWRGKKRAANTIMQIQLMDEDSSVWRS